MKRRDFLKLVCVAITAPSALAKTIANPVASSAAAIAGTPVLDRLSTLDELLREIYLPNMMNLMYQDTGLTKLLERKCQA